MKDITYQVIRSRRRTAAIQILPGGIVVVRCPITMPQAQIRELVNSKRNWICKALEKQPSQVAPMTAEQLRVLADKALQYIPGRVAYYAARMGVTYGRVTIRNQKTRWGSCSAKGNLNFNCLLMLAPEQVIDYVVIHELSHRIHMNHAAAFWETVAKYMPDYAVQRKWLKDNGAALLAQMP